MSASLEKWPDPSEIVGARTYARWQGSDAAVLAMIRAGVRFREDIQRELDLKGVELVGTARHALQRLSRCKMIHWQGRDAGWRTATADELRRLSRDEGTNR